MQAGHMLLVSIGLFLMPQLASAQVSASASVRAEVQQTCPGKSKTGKSNKCKPPKPPKHDDDDDRGEGHRIAASRSPVQSWLESAALMSTDGQAVPPSRVVVRLADPEGRSSVLQEWRTTEDQESLQDAFRWLMASHRLGSALNGDRRVITIIAEY